MSTLSQKHNPMPFGISYQASTSASANRRKPRILTSTDMKIQLVRQFKMQLPDGKK
jgi:hypothetical protein